MEIKTKFNIGQKVYKTKERYCAPAIVESIEISAYEILSHDGPEWVAVYRICEELLAGKKDSFFSDVNEDDLVATKEEWIRAKRAEQARADRFLAREIEKIRNENE